MSKYFSRGLHSIHSAPRRYALLGAVIIAAFIVSVWLTQEFFPPPAQPLTIYFGDALKLAGITVSPSENARGGSRLGILLEWRAQKKMNARYVMQVEMVDARGHVWADHVNEPGNGKFRTDRWGVNQRVLDEHVLDLPSTMPRGDYKITVQVYDPDVSWNLPARNATGRLILSEPAVATVQIQKDKSSVSDEQLQIARPFRLDIGDLSLLGFIPHPTVRVSRGEPLHIGIYWRARIKPSADYLVAVQVRDNAGNVLYENATRPAANTYPTMLWDAGEVLLDWHDFPIPISFRADPYQMFTVVRDAATQQSLGEAKIMNFSVVR